MKPNKYILAYAMFVAAIMAAARFRPGSANHRHPWSAKRHHDH